MINDPFLNYFLLFDLEEIFHIDVAKLEKKYFELQKQYHPDKYVTKPDQEKIAAAQKAVLVNEGYKILKDPLKRAEYLLSLKGVIVNKKNEGKKPDHEILLEAIAMREKLADANLSQEISAIAGENKDKLDNCLKNLEKAFNNNDTDSAIRETIRLKYLKKFEEDLKLKLK